MTRSKTFQLQKNGAKLSYAEVVKNSPAKISENQNSNQNQKINYAKIQAKCVINAEPLKQNTDQLDICLIKKRLQKAKRTLEDIQKLNSDQWTSLKKIN